MMDNTKDVNNSFIKNGSSYPGKLIEKQRSEILEKFAIKIISGQKNLEPKYQKLVNKHFWDLV